MNILASGHAAALWCGLSLILMLVLSALVVRQRQAHSIEHGDGGVPELAQAIRAFGNAAEYVPAGMATLGVMAVAGSPAIAIHLAGFVFFAGRVTSAVGLSLGLHASLPRAIGMILTWVALIFAAVALLIQAVV